MASFECCPARRSSAAARPYSNETYPILVFSQPLLDPCIVDCDCVFYSLADCGCTVLFTLSKVAPNVDPYYNSATLNYLIPTDATLKNEYNYPR